MAERICDHNCIPLRKWFRMGWVCVRCGKWSRMILPRAPGLWRDHV
jgi:hypothetical protein